MKEMFRHAAWLWTLAALLSAGGCREESVSRLGERPVAVSFGTYLRDARMTRATTPAGATGEIDDARLRETGFAVFAVHSGEARWVGPQSGTASQDWLFDFMWNQRVTWGGDAAGQVTPWTYEPLKYWPNDNTPADDQEDDSGNDPATGTMTADRVSFFAYAPYYDPAAEQQGTQHQNGGSGDTDDGDTGSTGDGPGGTDGDGIIALSGNGTTAATSGVTLRLPASMRLAESVDLLWAMQPNRYKTDGAGLTTGKVDLQFIHSLARLTVNVRTLVDRTSPQDTWEDYADDVEAANTRVLIERVEIGSPTLPREGTLLLTPQRGDGDGEAYPTVPTWVLPAAPLTATLAYGDGTPATEGTVAEGLRWTAAPADAEDAATAYEAFEALPAGVTKEEQPLTDATADSPYRVTLPLTAPQPLTVRVVYDVVTYDERLTMNTPRYFSIVRNDITYTSPQTVLFEANKAYTLRLLLGLTSVKFEVDADDWAVPMVIDGAVVGRKTVTVEGDVK